MTCKRCDPKTAERLANNLMRLCNMLAIHVAKDAVLLYSEYLKTFVKEVDEDEGNPELVAKGYRSAIRAIIPKIVEWRGLAAPVAARDIADLEAEYLPSDLAGDESR